MCVRSKSAPSAQALAARKQQLLWSWRDRVKWEVETARQRKEIMLMIYQELTQCMRMVVGQAKVLEKGLDKVRPIDAMTLREVRLSLSRNQTESFRCVCD